jgi:alkanesulfonate monooxygenase SsuD/methylene tetrahydromethanopterin reductase-like flavin-dependent oxidoreductase (luciferase family)
MRRWGVLLPTFDPFRARRPARVAEAARLAEDLGFDAAWAGDHLACHAPVLDAPSCLAAAAAVTERIALGLSVMLLGLRPPAWAAKQLATVDALSGGRLVLGVGVGGEHPEEFAAAGVPVAQRGRRLDEALEHLPDLLCGRPVRHAGLLELDVPALEPAMAAPPRLFVGGRGEHALRRTARFGDAWLPMWLEPRVVAERADRLCELAAERGRPAPDVALLIGVHVDGDAQRARSAAAAHLDAQYRLPLAVVERWTALGAVDQVAEQVAAHGEAGVGEVVLMPLGPDPLEQYERLAEVRERLGPAARAAVAAVAAAPDRGAAS